MLKWFIAAIALWATYQIRLQLTPFILAAIFAYMLSGPVTIISEKLRIGRGFATAIVYLLVVGSIGYGIYSLSPMIAEQTVSLFNNRHDITVSLINQISEATGWQPDVAEVTKAIAEKVQAFIAEKPTEILAVGHLITHSLISVLICLVTSVYLVLDGKIIGRFFLRFVPEEKREHWSAMASEINVKFSKYLVGQLFLIGIMTALAFAILSLKHVHYALILATIIGVLEIIPMLGPLMALAISGVIITAQLGISEAGIVVGMLWLARVVEDHVVIPRVIGHAVQIHPAITIFAVTAGETLGGALGMLLAVPMAAAIKVVLDNLHPPIAEEVAAAVEQEVPALTAKERYSLVKATLKGWWEKLVKWCQDYSFKSLRSWWESRSL
jgi:predicted PurR-regulated permease PerM